MFACAGVTVALFVLVQKLKNRTKMVKFMKIRQTNKQLPQNIVILSDYFCQICDNGP